MPFHMWAPDVYDGSPTPVTGFMATGVKAAAFVALVRVLSRRSRRLTALWQPVIAVLAIASMIVGNLVALAQRTLKRMLAYSSIAHAGYLLVAVWAGARLGRGSGAALSPRLRPHDARQLRLPGGARARMASATVTNDDIAGLASHAALDRRWGSASACCRCWAFPGTFGFIGKWYILSAIDRPKGRSFCRSCWWSPA